MIGRRADLLTLAQLHGGPIGALTRSLWCAGLDNWPFVVSQAAGRGRTVRGAARAQGFRPVELVRRAASVAARAEGLMAVGEERSY